MRKNWLAVLSVPFILLVMAGSAWAWTTPTTSGSADWKAYQDVNRTTLGGDSVNFAVNILDATGAVNTASNGNDGDVLIEVKTQLGAAPAGGFAANILQYVAPAAGVISFNIAYATTTGTDQVVINVYESVALGGATLPGQVTYGNLLDTATFNVEVEAGSATVNNLAIVAGNVDDDGDGTGTNLGPDDPIDDPADGGGADLDTLFPTYFGETLYTALGAGAGNSDVTMSMAGVEFGLHVFARAGEAIDLSRTGTDVKVAFLKVGSISFPNGNANQPDITASTLGTSKATIYTAGDTTGVTELEVTLTDGRWDGTVSIQGAGYYVPVVYQDHDDGTRAINVQREAAAGTDNLIFHYVAPNNTIAPTTLTLSAGVTAVPDDVDDDNTVDDPLLRGFSVGLQDTYGNPYPAGGDTTVSFSVTPDGSVPNATILAGNNSVRTAGNIDLPDDIGNWSVTANGSGLTSSPASVKVVDTALDRGLTILDTDGNLTGDTAADGLSTDFVPMNAAGATPNIQLIDEVPATSWWIQFDAPAQGTAWAAPTNPSCSANIVFDGTSRVQVDAAPGAGNGYAVYIDAGAADGVADFQLNFIDDDANDDIAGETLLLWSGGAMLVDNDGTNDGDRTLTAGSEVYVWMHQPLVDGLNLVGSTAYLGSYSGTVQKTEQAVFGADIDGNGSTQDYVVAFTATGASGGPSYNFGISGDSVAPMRFANGDNAPLVGLTAGAGTTGAFSQDFVINPAASSSVAYVDWMGNELTTYNLGFGTDFMVRGQRFQLQDSHGNNVGPVANLNFMAGISSTDNGSGLTVTANDGNDLAPNYASLSNTGVNMGLHRAAAEEDVTLRYLGTVADDSDVITANLSSTAASSYDFTLLNIGNPWSVAQISSNSGVTDTIEMPQNGLLPVVVETFAADGSTRMPSDNGELLVEISNTNITLADTDGNPAVINTGFAFDTLADGDLAGNPTNGRMVFRLAAGNNTGETTITVKNNTGTITSNTLTIDVKAVAPDQPTQGNEITAGSGSTDPADVTATENDTVDLFVFTDIDGFTPTACWVTLNIDGTNYYWVYDEANSAWKRFNFVPEGHADFNASFPTLAEAITDYPFTATGADQQVGNDLPMTGLSGLVFKVTVWYFDADGALQSFDYLVTVS